MLSRQKQIGSQLAVYFAGKGLTQAAVAKRFGVSQSWVGRVYAGHFTIRSHVAKRMCREARIDFLQIEEEARRSSDSLQPQLLQLLDQVWDGTAQDAKYLIKTLRMLGKLRQYEG